MSHVLRHRLRNIASGISSAVHLIASDEESSLTPDLREYFPLMLRECDDLSNMATRLSLFWDAPPESQPESVASITALAIDNTAQRFPQVAFRQAGDIPQAKVPSIMQVALQELLHNACEASSNGIVGLQMQQQDDSIAWSISDSGPGIETALRERAFLPFYTTRPRHLGLGLALAARLARLVHGDCFPNQAQCRANEWTVTLCCPTITMSNDNAERTMP